MFLSILQIIVAVLLIILILLQERSSGLSGVLGGGEAGSSYQTRRGLEKLIFYGTIVLAVIFVILALLNLIK
ncbi:MAG: preprotein translocase subunit SecG [Candidatus Paceibacterota bacterium]